MLCEVKLTENTAKVFWKTDTDEEHLGDFSLSKYVINWNQM